LQNAKVKEDAPRPSRFQIRSRGVTAMVLEPSGRLDAEFFAALDETLERAPRFFSNAPAIVDLNAVAGLDKSGDFTGLLRELRARRLAVVGVQNGTLEQNAAAAAAGLATLHPGRPAQADEAPRPAAPERGATRIVDEPVRSGQRISVHGDLVVAAAVGAGAELAATGSIHVYGALRGRALAGVEGDAGARIFCQSLEAELIAIAGLYRTSDDLDPALRRGRAQAFLRGESLVVESLK